MATSADREYWKNNILNRLDAIERELKALRRQPGVSLPGSGTAVATTARDPALGAPGVGENA